MLCGVLNHCLERDGFFFCVGFENILLNPSAVVLQKGYLSAMGYLLHHEPMLENRLPLPLLPSSHWSVLYAAGREQHSVQE